MAEAIGFGVAGLVGVTVSATTAAIIGSGVIAVGTIGANYIAGSLLREPVRSANKPGSLQQELRQEIPPRRRSYGRVRLSGSVWFFDRPIVQSYNLFYGIAINHGRIGGFVSFHIDEREVELNGSDLVTTVPYNGQATYLLHRLGLPTETAYDEIFDRFGVPEARGDGVASLLGIFDSYADPTAQTSVYPGGLPSMRVTIDASVVFDPRNPAHDIDDESTYETSENPIVCLLDEVIGADGMGIDYAARILPNIAEWKAAMDICDEAIALAAGGISSLYRIAATFDLTERPIDVVKRILSTCDGRMWTRRDGTLGISVGRFVPPSVTIERRDIVGYRFERGQDQLTSIAGLRAQYMSPDHDYKEHEAEPWPSGAAVLAFEEDRVDSLDLTWVPSQSQARRLMKREYIRRASEYRGTIATNLAGLRAIDERYIRIRLDELGIDDTFEVTAFTLDPEKLTCNIEVLSIGADVDAWDPSEEGDPDTGLPVFQFLSSFTKSGTAVDPIAEAGGVAGQTALVFCAGATVAATPAGWGLIQKAGPTSSLAFGAFWKVLDGTETSTAFLGTSGPIIVAFIEGAPAPTFEDKAIQITTAEPGGQQLNASGAPFAMFAFAAANVVLPDTDCIFRFSGTGPTDDSEEQVLAAGAISGVVKLTIYRVEEVPTSPQSVNMSDEGMNAFMTFVMRPGG